MLDEEGYATADYQDLARKRFIKAWEGLVDGYKVSLSSDMICRWLPHQNFTRKRSLKATTVCLSVSPWMFYSNHGKDL